MSKLSERMRDERCLRAGHNIQYFRSEENRIQNATFALDQQISDVQEEIDALEKEIQSIEAVQAAARAAGSATGNPALSAVSELGGQALLMLSKKMRRSANVISLRLKCRACVPRPQNSGVSSTASSKI